MKTNLFLPLLLLCVALVSCSTTKEMTVFREPSQLPSHSNLPDPLQMLDGRPVRSPSEWRRDRRPELKRLFAHYMYGSIPPKPEGMKVNLLGEYKDFLQGKATLKLLRLETGPEGAPEIDLMLVTPQGWSTRAPTFLAMNFCGNHALAFDPRIPLSKSWMGSNCQGCPGNVATDAARGSQANNWPLEEIINRGYAIAAFYSGDVDSDRANVSDGVYRYLAQGDAARNNPTNRGTIAAWAWGFQRCVDYLVTDPAVDPARIATVGHSRNGKTALLAAAYDERVALAIAHQAGCGGSAPSRGTIGESVKAINDRFPHWFNGEFKKFNESPEKLPFDQNGLVALCAPRPVLFTAAEEDQWANPHGQFEVLRAAEDTYRLLGVEGLGVQEVPPHDQLVGKRLGYYIREGKHSMTADDWRVFLMFTDHQWGATSR